MFLVVAVLFRFFFPFGCRSELKRWGVGGGRGVGGVGDEMKSGEEERIGVLEEGEDGESETEEVETEPPTDGRGATFDDWPERCHHNTHTCTHTLDLPQALLLRLSHALSGRPGAFWGCCCCTQRTQRRVKTSPRCPVALFLFWPPLSLASSERRRRRTDAEGNWVSSSGPVACGRPQFDSLAMPPRIVLS